MPLLRLPKVNLEFILISDGSHKPYKCKIRAPGFSHLQAMDYLLKGHMLADVPAVLGSLDHCFWRGRSMSIKKISKIQPETFEFSER